jgi:hypothetical protein
MTVDGEKRHFAGWESWAVTTTVAAGAYVPLALEAARLHETQLPSFYPELISASPVDLEYLLGTQTFYRAYSLVNGGRAPETDLFEGLLPVARESGGWSDPLPQNTIKIADKVDEAGWESFPASDPPAYSR